MEFLQRYWQQARQVWLGMSLGRRVLFSVVAALSVAAVVGVGYWASQPDYRVLYSELSAEDAGAITAKLQTQGVSFRLAANGTTIMVPAEQVQQLRLDLSVEGLPAKGGKGFELLDGNQIGTTPFGQHVNYTRALQTELARTIMQIEPVAFARIHLVQPEESPFIRERKPATASVVLKIKPGATLSHSTAIGIAAMVARSVEGLTPDQVTLLDTNGHVLLDPKGDDAGAIPSTQLEYKREYEAYLASKAEDILTRVVGPGRAVVRVTADINFKSETVTKETYDLDQKAIKKETVQTHTSTAAAPAARRPAGLGSSVAKAATPAPPPSAAAAGKDNEENSDVEYYTPPKTVEQQVEAAGGVDRLTIAVMVDREAVPSLTLMDVQDITKEAVGFKTGRDEIKATDAKLTGPPVLTGVDAEIQENQRWQNYALLARNASLGLTAICGLVVLGAGYWVYGRRKGPAKVETASASPSEYGDTLQSLSAQAQQDPEALAQLLATWLGEAETPVRKAA